MGHQELGLLLKAIDLDVAVLSGLASAVCLVSLWTQRSRMRLLGRLMMALIVLMAHALCGWTGNLAWAFYLGCVDPYASVARPFVRLYYLSCASVACLGFLAVAVAGRCAPVDCDDACLWRWWTRAFWLSAALDAALLAAVVAADAYVPDCAR